MGTWGTKGARVEDHPQLYSNCRASLSYLRPCLGRGIGRNLLSDWHLIRTDGRSVLELSFGFHHIDEAVWNPQFSINTQVWRIVADTVPWAICFALSFHTSPKVWILHNQCWSSVTFVSRLWHFVFIFVCLFGWVFGLLLKQGFTLWPRLTWTYSSLPQFSQCWDYRHELFAKRSQISFFLLNLT